MTEDPSSPAPRDPRAPLSLAEENVLFAFTERFLADREAGRPAGIATYLAMYPGHEELIALEWARLHAEGHADPEDSEQRVGPFVLEREIGRGGQAVVWLARDARLDRKVALKILRDGADGAEELVARFRREAEIAATLEDPGICPVYEVGVDEVPWIAMRYVEGQTLGEQIKDGAFSGTMTSTQRRGDVLTIFEKVARSLHVAHEAGVVHRDVKPGNVMISERGEPVILDFGIARQSGGGQATLTVTGQVAGTPVYMAPEQVRDGIADARSDVYALGVTLYEVLTGERPFLRATIESTFHAILEEEAPRIDGVKGSAGRDLGTVVATAMEKDPARRYATAKALADDLARVRRREPIAARRIGPVQRALRWGLRHPAAAALIVLLMIGLPVVAASAAYILLTRDDLERQQAADRRDAIESQMADALTEVFHGLVPPAIERLEELSREAPEFEELRAIHAWALLSEGRREEARAILENLPDQRFLRRMASRDNALLEDEDPEDAANAFEWFLAGATRLDAAHRTVELEPYARSAHMLRLAVLESDRPHLAFHSEYAHALSHVLDFGAAVAADEARSLAETLIRRWPEDHNAWYQAGSLLARFDVDAARDALDRAIALAPRHRKFGLRIERARTLARVERAIDEALEDLEAEVMAAATPGERAFALQQLGLLLHNRRQHERAIEMFQEALELRGPFEVRESESAFGLANSFHQLERFEEAERAYRELLRLRPTAVNHGRLAILYLQMRRPEDGLVEARRAAAAPRDGAPGEAPVLAEVFAWLAATEADKGNFAEAVTWAEQGLATGVQTAPSCILAAIFALRADQSATALRFATAARKVAPDDPNAAMLLGTALLMTGSGEKGLDLMREARRLGRRNPEIERLCVRRAASGMQLALLRLLHRRRSDEILGFLSLADACVPDPVFRFRNWAFLVEGPFPGLLAEAGEAMAGLVPELPPAVLPQADRLAGLLMIKQRRAEAIRLLEAVLARHQVLGLGEESARYLEGRIEAWRGGG